MMVKLKDYLENEHSFDKKTLIGIFALLIVITGMFGFLYEFIFYYFNGGMEKFYWRGGNFAPWINIYAIGSLMIYFIAYKHRKKPLKVFLMSAISCGILEYVAGLGMYIIGNGMRCWDYNQEILSFGSIQGFVCLRSVLIFGLFSLILMYVVVPICFSIARKLNKNIFFILSITLCSIILIDEFYNLLIARIFDLPRASEIYSKIGFNYVKFK